MVPNHQFVFYSSANLVTLQCDNYLYWSWLGLRYKVPSDDHPKRSHCNDPSWLSFSTIHHDYHFAKWEDGGQVSSWLRTQTKDTPGSDGSSLDPDRVEKYYRLYGSYHKIYNGDDVWPLGFLVEYQAFLPVADSGSLFSTLLNFQVLSVPELLGSIHRERLFIFRHYPIWSLGCPVQLLQ